MDTSRAMLSLVLEQRARNDDDDITLDLEGAAQVILFVYMFSLKRSLANALGRRS